MRVRHKGKSYKASTKFRYQIGFLICQLLGHDIHNLQHHAYPGHVFCSRCRRHMRLK